MEYSSVKDYIIFDIMDIYLYIVSVILSYSHYQVVIVALKSGGLPVDRPSDTEPFNYNKTSYNQVSFTRLLVSFKEGR